MIEHIVDGCNCPGKRCPHSDQIKCHGAFGRSWLKKDGLQVYCTACRVAHKRAGRPGRREKDRAISKAWHEKNREYDKARHKAYYEAHPNKRREHYEANHEKYREQNRVYHEANRDRHREQMNTYRRKNLEAFAVREANRRAHKARAGGSFTRQEWHDLCAYYDFTCLRCGKQEPEIELTVDHVVPLSQGGRNSIDNLQPLCRACNTGKHARTIDYRQFFCR